MMMSRPCDDCHEEDLQALLDATSESAFLLDPEGRFVAVNRIAAERLGRSVEDLLGAQAAEVWPADVAAFRLARLAEAANSGEPARFCDWRDGRLFEIACQPVRDGAGRVRRIAVFAHEKTAERCRMEALRAAEASYSDLFANAAFGIFKTTPDGRYLAANAALAQIYGFDTPEQLVAGLTDIGGQLYVDPRRRAEFRRLLSASDAVHNFESEVRRRDGTTVWITETARAVRDGRGRLLYYEGMVEDVGERRRTAQLERDLAATEAARRAAVAAAEAKSQFLAHMSHELRTPLNAIIGFSDVLATGLFGALPPRQADYAASINGAGLHLLELINQVLDLAKVEAGKLELHDEPIPLAELVGECVVLVREGFAKGGARIAVEVAEPLPAVRADRLRLKQILLNLLSNAVKFTPERGEIRVSLAPAAAGGVAVAVADSGKGIAADDLERVMEPFAQARSDTAPEGTGLGLPLSRRLAEAHGGRLTLASSLGCGTTATLWLPPERVLLRPA